MVKRNYNLKIERLPSSKLNLKKLPIAPNLSNKIDLSFKMPPIYDQGNLGSCTSNALCALVTYNKPTFVGSRLFLYYCERIYEKTINTDSGATLQDGIKSLVNYGICSEYDWPYIISQFNKLPPPYCFTNALRHLISVIKPCLRQNNSEFLTPVAKGSV